MNLASWIIFFSYKEAQTITTGYEKEINPSSYTEEVDPANFYDQFNDSVLSETITKTVTDAEGNNLSQTTTYLRGKNKTETVTTYENDDFGRTVKENTIQKKYQDGRWLPSYETEVSYTYDENGNVTETETKSRKEGETDWQTQKTKAVYDSKGQVTKEYSPRGVKENVAAAYTYDLLGRKIKEELPQNKTDGSAGYQTVVNEYDKSGNLVETKEQIEGDKNKEIEYTYDKQGNLVQVKSSLENEKAQYVQYVYDEQGNKVRQFTGMTGPLTVTVAAVENAKDDAGKDTFTYGGKTYAVLVTGKKKSDTIRETKYVYDTKNRLVSYTDPEGRTETYTYDCNSNLTKTVDKNGNILKNTYDNKNRLTERTAKEKKTGKETVHTYRYNAYGDVAVQDDTQFVYGDVSGQVTKETTKLTKNKDVVKNYTYDSKGNKSTFSVKAGEDTKLSLSYEYDGSSRLISVKDSEGNQAVSYAYDTEGSLSERQAADGLKTTYGYDYQNRLTSMTNETGKGVVSKYSSTYLKNGQKAEEVSTVMDKNGKSTKKTAAYTYDMLGRIARETKTGREDISYTYDANNNRKQMTIGNKTTAYQYNKNDELLRTDTLHTDTEKNDVVIYKNDKNGNQLATVNRSEIPAEAKDTSYIDVDVTLGDNQLNDNVVNHYNALNQLTETLTKNYKVSFTYDAEGLRTGKTVNGEKTVYVWDGDQVVMELSKGGAVQKRYIRGNDLVYADKGENTEKTYYVTDMHGNVVQLLDESGNVTKTYEYDSFGNEVKPEKKDENPYRYCGEYYDKETEEVYLRARYYQPSVGRFITRDTYTGESDEPLSLHLYTYCENDGVNAWDPSGHTKESVINVHSVKKGKREAVLIKAGLELDVDGSPRAYAPDNKKYKPLDYLENAKNGFGGWCGIYTKNGKPIKQKYGVYKGYYISTTALENERYDKDDTRRYVNSEKIPYIVNSRITRNKHIELGDICYVWNKKKKKGSYAIVADNGPSGKFGEGAIKLAKNIGVGLYMSSSGKYIGTNADEGRNIQYIIFKNVYLSINAIISYVLIKQFFIYKIGGITPNEKKYQIKTNVHTTDTVTGYMFTISVWQSFLFYCICC